MTNEIEETLASVDKTPIESDDSVFGVSATGEIDPSMLADESSRAIVDPTIYAEGLAFETFDEAGLDAGVLDAIRALGWEHPTPVQRLCLPFTLKGTDVAGFAQTGTGKTGVFLTTFAQRFLTQPEKKSNLSQGAAAPFAIVLAPTRELAMQIHDDACSFLQPIGAKSLAVFGGIDYEKQAKDLKGGIDLVVATPGRLKDFFQKKIISMSHCELFVCDEVDRMFDMGFIEDVEYFLEKIPEKAQKLLFSATTNDKVKELAFEYLEKPQYISVNPEIITPENIEQHAILCDLSCKLRVMLGLLREHNPSRAVIFANTKLTAQWLHYKLKGNGISADVITGDLPQRQRINLIRKIKEGQVRILIGTDVASRGLHISDITHVYNFDLPDEAANYVHRIGRTARAGAKGVSYSLVCEEYGENLEKIQTLLGDAAPKSTWFDPSYLEIKDTAGNPFEDNFGLGSKPQARLGREPRERTRSPDHEKSGRSNQARHGKPRREEKSEQPNPRRTHGDRPSQQKHRENGPRDHSRRPKHETTIPSVAVASTPTEAVPTTTTGFIKKVFGLFFGRKK